MREESDVDRCRGMRGSGVHWAHCKNAAATIGEIADTISKKLVPGLGELAFVNEWGGYALVRYPLGAAIAETLLSDALVSSPSVVGINS
jgi:hypothetical protein